MGEQRARITSLNSTGAVTRIEEQSKRSNWSGAFHLQIRCSSRTRAYTRGAPRKSLAPQRQNFCDGRVINGTGETNKSDDKSKVILCNRRRPKAKTIRTEQPVDSSHLQIQRDSITHYVAWKRRLEMEPQSDNRTTFLDLSVTRNQLRFLGSQTLPEIRVLPRAGFASENRVIPTLRISRVSVQLNS